jgi:hypothetical protein
MLWRRPLGKRAIPPVTGGVGQREQVTNGTFQYVGEGGGNNSGLTYQDATGAPIESKSPLGYSVGPVTITLLNITMMIGAGIYSTRKCDKTTHSQIWQLTWRSIIYSVGYWLNRPEFCLLDPWLLGMSQRS